MRALLLLAALLAPFAAASQPTPPWEFREPAVEGTGAVGEPIQVLLRVQANAPLDARIVLRAPEWVLVEGETWDARAAAGETVEHAWTLVPTQEGFWAAVAHEEGSGSGASCACVMGFAGGPPESVVGTSAEGAVPVPLLERALLVTPTDDGQVRVERSVTPVSSWLAHATLRVWITEGSTYLCDSCAVSGPVEEARAPGTDTVTAAAVLPLAEGNAYTLWDEVVVAFQTPPESPLEPQAQIPTGCENRRYGTDEPWSCEEPSDEWAHMLPLGERVKRSVPAPLPLAAFALAALLLQRPPRGKRR